MLKVEWPWNLLCNDMPKFQNRLVTSQEIPKKKKMRKCNLSGYLIWLVLLQTQSCKTCKLSF